MIWTIFFTLVWIIFVLMLGMNFWFIVYVENCRDGGLNSGEGSLDMLIM